MLLFRYFEARYALSTLTQQKLRASRPSRFNDPFELRFKSKRNMTLEEAKEHVQQRLQDPAFRSRIKGKPFDLNAAATGLYKNFPELTEQHINQSLLLADQTVRVICFSREAANEGLLWAHYADKHQGVRIGFEFPSLSAGAKLVPINYVDELLDVDLTKPSNDLELHKQIQKTITAKGRIWEYEHEERLLLSNQLFDSASLLEEAFWGFKPAWIKTVDLGLRIEENMATFVTEITRRDYPQASLRKAKLHQTQYSLLYEELPSVPK